MSTKKGKAVEVWDAGDGTGDGTGTEHDFMCSVPV